MDIKVQDSRFVFLNASNYVENVEQQINRSSFDKVGFDVSL